MKNIIKNNLVEEKKCDIITPSYNFYQVSFDFGAIDILNNNPNSILGLAHFLEHLIVQSINEYFLKNSIKVVRNFASTDYDSILMTWILNSKLNIKKFENFLYNITFTTQEINNEKKIITQEIKLYENHEPSKRFRKLLVKQFSNYALEYDIAGDYKSIELINSNLLNSTYRKILESRSILIMSKELFKNHKLVIKKFKNKDFSCKRNLNPRIYIEKFIFEKIDDGILYYPVTFYTVYEYLAFKIASEIILNELSYNACCNIKSMELRFIKFYYIIIFYPNKSIVDFTKSDVIKIKNKAKLMFFDKEAYKNIVNKILLEELDNLDLIDFQMKIEGRYHLKGINLNDIYSVKFDELINKIFFTKISKIIDKVKIVF